MAFENKFKIIEHDDYNTLVLDNENHKLDIQKDDDGNVTGDIKTDTSKVTFHLTKDAPVDDKILELYSPKDLIAYYKRFGFFYNNGYNLIMEHGDFEIHKHYEGNHLQDFDNNPSQLVYEKGELIAKVYHREDKLHRVNGPAIEAVVIREDNTHIWAYNGQDFTENVNQYMSENGFEKWEDMPIDEINEMIVECL